MSKEIIPVDQIAHRIRQLRGEKVLLDYDLAALYAIEPRGLVISFPVSLLAIAGFYRSLQPAIA